MVTGS